MARTSIARRDVAEHLLDMGSASASARLVAGLAVHSLAHRLVSRGRSLIVRTGSRFLHDVHHRKRECLHRVRVVRSGDDRTSDRTVLLDAAARRPDARADRHSRGGAVHRGAVRQRTHRRARTVLRRDVRRRGRHDQQGREAFQFRPGRSRSSTCHPRRWSSSVRSSTWTTRATSDSRRSSPRPSRRPTSPTCSTRSRRSRAR